MPAISLPSSRSNAGQLYADLEERFRPMFDFDQHRPPTMDEMKERYDSVAELFGVTLTYEQTMPEDLITDRADYYWNGETNVEGPAYSPEFWPGYFVVRTPKNVLCFGFHYGYESSSSIFFTVRPNEVRFGGYGQMSVRYFFKVLFSDFGWNQDEKAQQAAAQLSIN